MKTDPVAPSLTSSFIEHRVLHYSRSCVENGAGIPQLRSQKSAIIGGHRTPSQDIHTRKNMTSVQPTNLSLCRIQTHQEEDSVNRCLKVQLLFRKDNRHSRKFKFSILLHPFTPYSSHLFNKYLAAQMPTFF